MVQVDLTGMHNVCLEAIGFLDKKTFDNDKRLYDMLHVRSISHWAPSCIGPYSQASKLFDKFIFMAGMIGLIPSTMSMVKVNTIDEIKLEIKRCWKNVKNVLTVFDGDLDIVIQHNVFALAVEEIFQVQGSQSDQASTTENGSNVQGSDEVKESKENTNDSSEKHRNDASKESKESKESNSNTSESKQGVEKKEFDNYFDTMQEWRYDCSAIDDDNVEDDDIDADVYQRKQIGILNKEIDKTFSSTIKESIGEQLAEVTRTRDTKDVLDRKEKKEEEAGGICNCCIFYVSKLPKNALIEIQSLSLTKNCIKQLKNLSINEISEMSNNDSKNENSMSESKSESKIDSSNETITTKTIVGTRIESKTDNEKRKDDKSKKIKLKYAHLRKKRKKIKEKYFGHKIYKKQSVNEVGNILEITNIGTFNIFCKWINLVSMCRIIVDNVIRIEHFQIEMIDKVIKNGLRHSIRTLQSFSNIITKQDSIKLTNQWIIESVVFIRVYYHCELLEPKWLLEQFEQAFKESAFSRIPAISLIPTRGMDMIQKNDSNVQTNSSNKRGLFCFNVLLHSSLN